MSTFWGKKSVKLGKKSTEIIAGTREPLQKGICARWHRRRMELRVVPMPSLPDLRRSRCLEPSMSLSSQQSTLEVKQGCVKPPKITQNVPFM